MALCGCFCIAVGLIIAIAIWYIFRKIFSNTEPPVLPDGYYGPGITLKDPKDFPRDDTSIKPFEIHVEESILEDLTLRLKNTRFVQPLDNVQFQYGFHGDYLRQVVEYWKTQFDWRKQEKIINEMDQFTTQIEGINVHFIHQKPNIDKDAKHVRVLPLLIIHGWPGTIVEFLKIIPMLTTPREDRDYVFEVIAPSIPGYGFSEAPHQPGFSPIAAARLFHKLMQRLGFQQYYVQGGDWGSFIATTMAKVYPEKILGCHINMVAARMRLQEGLKYAIGYIFPSMFMTPEEHDTIYPIMDHVYFLLQETGYLHIQATKPDTVSAALTDSPAGLAAYILEKFSTWTDRNNRELKDGGLTIKYSLDELLTNVMVYWVTNTIASSTRFYKECFIDQNRSLVESLPVKVPSGLAMFPNELSRGPKSFLTHYYVNLVRFRRLPQGGHFAAMEEPQLLADEIWDFVLDVQKYTAAHR